MVVVVYSNFSSAHGFALMGLLCLPRSRDWWRRNPFSVCLVIHSIIISVTMNIIINHVIAEKKKKRIFGNIDVAFVNIFPLLSLQVLQSEI